MTVHSMFEDRERTSSVDVRRDALESGSEGTSLHLRTQFLRRVAHDIASPAGLSATVLDELASSETPRPELVAMARRGLKRLLRLSEQLALTADLEAGTFAPETSPEDLRAIAKQALENAVAIDGRREVTASCVVPEERLPVEVDRRLLTAVLREVTSNALRLATSRVEMTVEKQEDRMVVRVSDDGSGFKDDALAFLHAHSRFAPGSAARGLGLSLSLAQQVLAAHGGELRIEQSTLPPGRKGKPGAAVVVVLPRADQTR